MKTYELLLNACRIVCDNKLKDSKFQLDRTVNYLDLSIHQLYLTLHDQGYQNIAKGSQIKFTYNRVVTFQTI